MIFHLIHQMNFNQYLFEKCSQIQLICCICRRMYVHFRWNEKWRKKSEFFFFYNLSQKHHIKLTTQPKNNKCFYFIFPPLSYYQNGHHFLPRAVLTLNSPLKSCLIVLKEILCLLFNATLFRVYFRLAIILVSCEQNTIAIQLP